MCECFSCKKAYAGWRPKDDPLSLHAEKCAYASMAREVKEGAVVPPPTKEESELRWGGVTWRTHPPRELDEELEKVQELAEKLEGHTADKEAMDRLVEEARGKVEALHKGGGLAELILAPVLSDPVEEVSNNAFLGFLEAFQ